MEVLLIKPSEIAAFTPLSGNVDEDKYKYCIYDVQVTVIEPLLGTKLYEKLKTDFEAGNITGKYKILLENYLKPILRHQVFAEYVEVASFNVANGGIFKHQPANSEVVGKSEVQYLAQTARSKAQLFIERAEKYLRGSGISEYAERGCGSKNIRVSAGWHL
jgi:hypothetical protein